MKKIAFNLLVLFVLASFVLSACGSAATPVATEAPVSTAGEGEVAIVAWPGYIERGANDAVYYFSSIKTNISYIAHLLLFKFNILNNYHFYLPCCN